MKNKIIISIIVVVVLIGVVRFTAPLVKSGPARTEDVIWKMLVAARTGNIQQYLDCFGGASLATLQENRKQSENDEVFRNYIKRDVQDIKSMAIINGMQDDPLKAVYEVEVVYADRNEDQTYSLEKTQGAWKIVDISRPAISKQPIRYMDTVVKE